MKTPLSPISKGATTTASRIADWRSRDGERHAARVASNILRKSGVEISALEASRLGRTDLPGLLTMAKESSGWALAKPHDRTAIEAALTPPPTVTITTLADLKAALSPADMRSLSVEDRFEIMSGTSIFQDHRPEPLAASSIIFGARPAPSISKAANKMARADFSKLNPAAKMAFVKNGGKLTD